MADAALENVLEIDDRRAEAAKKRAEELAQGLPADSDVYLTQMAALRRSTMRLDAARRYKSGEITPGLRLTGQMLKNFEMKG